MKSDAPRIVSSLVLPNAMLGATQMLLAIGFAIDSRRPLGPFLGIALFLMAALTTVHAVRAASTRVSEGGVSQLTWRGRRLLAFADVTGMTKNSRELNLSASAGRVTVPVAYFENTASAIRFIESRLPSHVIHD